MSFCPNDLFQKTSLLAIYFLVTSLVHQDFCLGEGAATHIYIDKNDPEYAT